MSETHFSCDTVDRELRLAILSSLLCPETDRNIRIGKQGYVFYFTDFKKCNLVPRAHVPFGQHQDTELWNNQFPETKILGLPASRRMRGLV